MTRAVVFDVGETLLDDTRGWRLWAEWMNVPPHTLSALIGAVTVQGLDNSEALRLIRPGVDVPTEWQRRSRAGQPEQILESDLYSDVRATLSELKSRGYWVGIAGNQTKSAAQQLRALNLPADDISASDEWNATKPDMQFFRTLIQWVGEDPRDITYVGDHRDHDIVPANTAGLLTAHIRRGPWGYLWADDPTTITSATWRIDRLIDLPRLLGNAT